MANEISTLQSGPAKGPLIATFAIGALQHPRTTGGEQRNQHSRLAKIRAATGRNPGPAVPRQRSNSDRNRKRAISNRKSGAGNPPPVPAPSALFSSKIAPYIGGAGSPAMEINN